MTTRIQIAFQAAVEHGAEDGGAVAQQIQVPPIVVYSKEKFEAQWAELGQRIAELWDTQDEE